MVELVSLILLVAGILLTIIPQKVFKKFNNIMMGLFLAGTGVAYIFGYGLVETINRAIDLIKGWIV